MSSTLVSLPYAKDPIPLSVEDKVTIASDLWRYAAETINSVESEYNWLSRDLPDPAITGVVRWLGTLPSISDTQLFAGIQTVSIIIFLYFSIPFNFTKIDHCKAVCFFAIFCIYSATYIFSASQHLPQKKRESLVLFNCCI